LDLEGLIEDAFSRLHLAWLTISSLATPRRTNVAASNGLTGLQARSKPAATEIAAAI
jgi:hypothetical protein